MILKSEEERSCEEQAQSRTIPQKTKEKSVDKKILREQITILVKCLENKLSDVNTN